jgi:hypothetical protein
MSTIIASNVSDGTLSIPTTYVTNGSAKAWVNFNGTGTVAIRESFNVASITDNGTGDYTVNFTTALTDANYATVGMAGDTSTSGGYAIAQTTDRTKTTSAVSIGTRSQSGGSPANTDYGVISLTVTR